MLLLVVVLVCSGCLGWCLGFCLVIGIIVGILVWIDGLLCLLIEVV